MKITLITLCTAIPSIALMSCNQAPPPPPILVNHVTVVKPKPKSKPKPVRKPETAESFRAVESNN